MLDPHSGRATVIENGSDLHISIRSSQSILVTGFIGFWLLGWAFGWVMVASQLFSGNGNLFLFGWLGAWTIGGIFAIAMVMWGLVGKEVVQITDGKVTIARKIPIWSRQTACNLAEVNNLRIIERDESFFGRRNQMPGLLSKRRQGVVRFDYGYHTIGFGLDLDPAEASKIVEILETRYPSMVAHR